MRQRLRRILPLVTFAMVLLIGFASVVFLIDRRLVESDKPLIDERVRAARASAAGAALWFLSYRESAEKIAKSLEPWTGSSAQTLGARGKLDAGLTEDAVFDRGALILTTAFAVASSSTARAAEVGVPRRFPHAEQAARGRATFSDLFEDPVDKTPQFGAAIPLRDGSRVTGVLLTFSSLQPLTDLSKRMGIHRADTYLVSPGGGEISAEVAATLIQKSTSETREPADEARAGGKAGFHQYPGEGGVPKSASYAPIEESYGWVLVLAEDTSAFLPHASRPVVRLTAPGPTRTAAISLGIIAIAVIAGAGALLRKLRVTQVDADRTKRAFLAVTGHELRTPLTSIRGFAQLLQTRWERMTDEQRADMLTTVARQARNLEHLVERLLVGAQIEAGMAPGASIKEIDIAEAAKQLVEHHQALNPLHSIEVDIDGPMTVKADSKMFEQVLNHVVENAIKYSPDGGMIWIKGRRNGRWVELTVEDEGVGLPSDSEAIFEKFAQGEEVDTRTYDEGGVGLGLFIARHHLSQMGGRIRAERRSPKGARIVMELAPAEK